MEIRLLETYQNIVGSWNPPKFPERFGDFYEFNQHVQKMRNGLLDHLKKLLGTVVVVDGTTRPLEVKKGCEGAILAVKEISREGGISLEGYSIKRGGVLYYSSQSIGSPFRDDYQIVSPGELAEIERSLLWKAIQGWGDTESEFVKKFPLLHSGEQRQPSCTEPLRSDELADSALDCLAEMRGKDEIQ